MAHVVKSGPPVNEHQKQEELLRRLKETDIRKEEKAAADKAKLDADNISAEKVDSEKAAADKIRDAKAATDKAAFDKAVSDKVAADNVAGEEKAAALKAVAANNVGEKVISEKALEEDIVSTMAADDTFQVEAAHDAVTSIIVGDLLAGLNDHGNISGKPKEKKLKLQGISQIVNVGSIESTLEGASQDTSKAGCSPASDLNLSSEGSDLMEGQELKITAISSCESSPRYHKPAAAAPHRVQHDDMLLHSKSLLSEDLKSGLDTKNSDDKI